jgi:hypothetical protein
MAKSQLTLNEQVRKLNQQQQAIDRKVRRLAPEGALEYTGTTDGTLLTWQSVLWAVSDAAGCLEDLAQDSIIDDLVEAKKAAAANPLAAAEPQTAMGVTVAS